MDNNEGWVIYFMKAKEKLTQLLLDGKIEEAGELIKSIDKELLNEEIQDVLLKVSFDNQSIAPYIVVIKLLLEYENANLHAFASTLFSNPLCWIEGAYYAGFYHQKKAVELEPQRIAFKEYLLSYNSLPEAILSDEEALKIRKQILKIDPDNKTVLNHFSSKRFVGKLD